MVNFPGSIDNGTTLPNPTAGSATNSPSHAGLHTNENTAIIAIEGKLGTGSSTPSGTNLLGSTGTGTSAWSYPAPAGAIVGTTDTQTLTNKTLTSPVINAPNITNATITTDAITGFTTSNSGTVYGVPISSGVLTTANTVNGLSLVNSSVPAGAIVNGSLTSTQIATNGVAANNLATNAITLGYVQITSNFSTSSTSPVQVTGLTLTVTIPSGGRRIRMTAYCTGLGSASGISVLTVWNGTVGSGTIVAQGNQAASNTITLATGTSTALSGSITFNVGLSTTAGTTTFNASSNSPGYIIIEAI